MAGGTNTAFLAIMAIAALSLVGLVGFMAFGGGVFQQTALPSTEEQQQAVTDTAALVSKGLKIGTAATANSRVYDLQEASQAQVATNLTIEEWNGDGYGVGEMRTIEDGTLSSATDDTATGTSIGKTLYACGGVGTHRNNLGNGIAYYGQAGCKTLLVDSETENVRVDVERATESLSLSCYNDGVIQGNTSMLGDSGNITGCAFTAGAAQIISLDYLKVELNTTDRSFYFKGIGVNISEDVWEGSSDLDDLTMSGSGAGYEGFDTIPSVTWATKDIPKRLKTGAHKVKYYFEVATPIVLHEWDVVKTAPVVFDFNTNNPQETGDFYIVDEAQFSASTENRRIKAGVQNDLENPLDIGAHDFILPWIVR